MKEWILSSHFNSFLAGCLFSAALYWVSGLLAGLLNRAFPVEDRVEPTFDIDTKREGVEL